ncbi:hypothetical protein HF682_04850 [Leeia sp. IMCC25680]|uniref:Uncharacterized protein n=1 Tax=Leeia aquatica TaxID=2725557 RepID=A0A847RTE1_9NEIS|nr:hypothetical protein [Leeia aquatica]
MRLDDLQYASTVVIGRVTHYEIVRDEDIRKRFPDRPPTQSYLSDYARFTIAVDRVLAGQASPTLTVTWDNSTFGEPEHMDEGPYLIALRSPKSRTPPLRGPSATILPSAEPDILTVLQAPCAPAFFFDASSDEAMAIRRRFQKPAQ